MNSTAIEKAFSLTLIRNKAMSTLEAIKEQYAKRRGFNNWKANREYLNTFHVSVTEGALDEIYKLFASQQVKEALERAAETVIKELDFAGYAEGEQSLEEFSESAKESILSLIKEY